MDIKGITKTHDNKIKVDEHGNIRLPAALLEQQGIFTGDEFEIIMIDGRITLARHTSTCYACGDDCDVQKMHKTFLCGECRHVITESLGDKQKSAVFSTMKVEIQEETLEVIREIRGLQLIK